MSPEHGRPRAATPGTPAGFLGTQGSGMTGEPERPGALAVMRGIGAASQVVTLRAARRAAGRSPWPVNPGGDVIGDPSSSVAVCTRSDAGLAEGAAAQPGVAIAGRLYTANLGIERIIGADHTAAHRMRGNGAETMLAGLLRDGLVTQPGHAGYLGAELAKAETAMRLGASGSPGNEGSSPGGLA
jgi:hypothetical protein